MQNDCGIMVITGFVIHLSGKQNYYYEKELDR